MEKLYYLKRFLFLVLALGLVTTFISCDDDDEPKPELPALTDVEGNYIGKMLVLLPNPIADEGEDTPQGVDVTVVLKESNVMFDKFPVDELITSIVGEEIASGIIETVGDVNYSMKYTATFSDDKSMINLAFAPEPLVLEIDLPADVALYEGDGEGETPKLKVEVTVAASETGTFTYSGSKLTFKLQVTAVKIDDESIEFPATTFSFDLGKTK